MAKLNSYHGKILHVDLSEERQWVEELGPDVYRKYLGGSALGAYLLMRDLKPGIDPLGPENILIFMTSVINGLPLSGANRYSVLAKSPLTGGFGEAEAGGYWGPELKRSGFDGIVVHGKASKPVYLFVHDSRCEIKDASQYWGKLSEEVQEGLEAELGDKRISVLQTGVGGENGVLYAAIANQLKHFHGRSGLGAVMGSKKLKAIVVRGKERLSPSDRQAANAVVKHFSEVYDKEVDGLHLNGTAGGITDLDRDGILPTRNFRDGSFEYARAITGATMSKEILVNRGTCFACTVACKREVEVPERNVQAKYGGMEYEIIGALGSLCGVGDLGAVAEASQWVNRYVIDGISAGVSIAFAMECYENGILTKEDTGGIELKWGDADAMIAMIHKIALREGIGNLLADGVKRAAEKLGPEAEPFALHVKGQELPMHEPRGKKGVGLQYAISPTGADHMEAEHDPTYEEFGKIDRGFGSLGLNEPVDRFDLGPKKVRAFYYAQLVWSLYNSIGMCDFVGMPINPLKLEDLRDYVNAATGWNMSIFELLKVGERSNTLARIFNLREGFTHLDDTLPDRIFKPLQNGKLEGQGLDHYEFTRALKLYYQMAGWDHEGIPTSGKISELDLNDVGILV